MEEIIKKATEHPNGMDCATLEEARTQLAMTRRYFENDFGSVPKADTIAVT